MKLQVLKRDNLKKSETKRLRREGYIPGALYVKGKATDAIALSGAEYTALVRTITPGRLSTAVFTLVDAQGHQRRAILKEIQYEPTTYRVDHLDFEELFDDVKIKVKVPIEFTGVVDCIGVKLGGVLRQVIRYLRVACLPSDIPEFLPLDVRSLQMAEKKRLSDLEIPPTVRPIANLNEVVVVVAKR